ncbi:hypothetical protein GCM10007103_30100 [Salinimicrobium marinum]|uniref:Uncharacterized protein n=1 Tax=Salinimicrobium marinum TaxID=680283 RepID=A0A918W0X0_9FLAO|nr:hypothetical protein [Salinimicrobium marinum]GHA47018.1 hypothetical protein GCM10007103_30100 [Salinimicrobium marinum]
MKKQLKEELITLAEKVLSLKQQESIDSEELKKLAKDLYERLTILNFTEKHLFSAEVSEEKETREPEKQITPTEEKKQPKQEEEPDRFAPDGTLFNDSEAITEPNTEKIKDIVAQMPPESQKFDEMLDHIIPKNYKKNDMEDIGGVHYDHLPQFEPVTSRSTPEADKPRSINDRLKKTFQIGINDRHAFVKHLFEGSTADYNRVLSQLNTMKNKEEAVNFVLNMVKPDYNNWEGKEEYEIRFLAIVESKFE